MLGAKAHNESKKIKASSREDNLLSKLLHNYSQLQHAYPIL
jgi:hypothetical protein